MLDDGLTPTGNPLKRKKKKHNIEEVVTNRRRAAAAVGPGNSSNLASARAQMGLAPSQSRRKIIRAVQPAMPYRAPIRTQPRREVTVPPITHPFLTGLAKVISPIMGMNPADYSSSFGPRVHPIHGGRSNPTGIDISSPSGTTVYAPSNAVVEAVRGNAGAYGNQVILGHGREKETMYGHLSGFYPGLKPGTKVEAGDPIGYVGSTGYSTGPHLHWETWVNGSPVNPMTFLGGN
jgi:murein DD-endopeptidase MepM/ murein hydrolase activator NlpD